MMNVSRMASILAIAAFLGACATPAPNYPPSAANAAAASRLNTPIAVGKFEFATGRQSDLNSVRARANTFSSPVNNSYTDYIANAARVDLESGGRLESTSPRVLSGVLEKNELHADGILTNESSIAVHFRLADAERIRYDKVVAIDDQWESSFLGAIAIPRAIQNYVVSVQKLIGKLFADPDFVAATAR